MTDDLMPAAEEAAEIAWSQALSGQPLDEEGKRALLLTILRERLIRSWRANDGSLDAIGLATPEGWRADDDALVIYARHWLDRGESVQDRINVEGNISRWLGHPVRITTLADDTWTHVPDWQAHRAGQLAGTEPWPEEPPRD